MSTNSESSSSDQNYLSFSFLVLITGFGLLAPVLLGFAFYLLLHDQTLNLENPFLTALLFLLAILLLFFNIYYFVYVIYSNVAIFEDQTLNPHLQIIKAKFPIIGPFKQFSRVQVPQSAVKTLNRLFKVITILFSVGLLWSCAWYIRFLF